MNSNDPEPDAYRIVRRYSIQVSEDLPNNELAQGLRRYEESTQALEKEKDVEVHEWQRWLLFEGTEASSDPAPLEQEGKELAAAWEAFQNSLPRSEQNSALSHGLPNIQTVKKTVLQAEQDWNASKEKGFGKARDWFYQFCDTLEAHSQLFTIFPQGDKYTSLFTGVISSIVKVSARHEEIAEGFSRALVEISADLDFSQRQGAIFQGPEMKKLAVQLYTRYFRFLTHVMSWYTSRRSRFKKSLNQKYWAVEVPKMVADIKIIVSAILREAELATQKKIQSVECTTNDINDKVKTLVTTDQMKGFALGYYEYIERRFELADENNRLQLQQISDKLDAFNLALGESTQRAMIAFVEGRLYEQDGLLTGSNSGEDSKRKLAISMEQGVQAAKYGERDGKPAAYSRQQMALDSRHLGSHIIASSAKNALPPNCSVLQVAGEIVTRLQAWISAASSRTLWIIGASYTSSRFESTSAAIHVTTIAEDRHVPCLFFFCKPSHLDSLDKDLSKTSHSVNLIALLYSLIQQLTELAPMIIEDDYDFRSAIGSLDGTPASIPIAFELLRALLRVAPRLLLCVIDGLQFLDHASTRQDVDQLVDILQCNDPNRVLKVLYTSNGFFSSGGRLHHSVRLDCAALPRKKPGRAQPGSQSLYMISLPKKP